MQPRVELGRFCGLLSRVTVVDANAIWALVETRTAVPTSRFTESPSTLTARSSFAGGAAVR